MKSVLITGGSGGIGSAAARLAASGQWTVFVGYDQGRERAEHCAKSISQNGGRAWPVFLPLHDESSLNRGLDVVADHSKQLHALVLSASPPPVLTSFLKTTEAMLQEQYRVNVIGNQRLITSVWKRFFRDNERSHIVALLTLAMGPPPQPQMVSYLIGKEALKALLTCALAELGTSGLRASAICPDYTDTPMLRTFDDHLLEIARAKQPGGQFMKPDHVARFIVHCLENPPNSPVLDVHQVSAEMSIP